MPLYHQILLINPAKSPTLVAEMFRRYARFVIAEGGVLRGIENHGVRVLPARTSRKYITADGERHFWKARYVSAYFDAPHQIMTNLNRLLVNEEVVIRHILNRIGSNVQLAKCRTYRNPYLHTVPATKTTL